MISREAMLPGDKILPQNDLAKQFSTTPVTIHKALTELVREGIIYRRKGVGTFVAGRSTRHRGGDRKVCLIMHRSGLECRENNPEYWCYLQDVIFEFTRVLPEGYSFSMKFAGEDTQLPQLIDELAGYHSIFFHYSNEVPMEIIKAVIRSRVAPVVKFGKTQEPLSCLTVDCDRFEDIRAGTNRLIELGHTRIGFIGDSEWWGDMALAGWRAALSGAGLEENPAFVFRTPKQRQGGMEVARTLLNSQDLPDALMVDSDLRAIGLVGALNAGGLRVPSDLSVISYDGLQLALYNPPYLTSIQRPFGDMISAAIREINSTRGIPFAEKVITVSGKLVEGATTRRRQPQKQTSPTADQA